MGAENNRQRTIAPIPLKARDYSECLWSFCAINIVYQGFPGFYLVILRSVCVGK